MRGGRVDLDGATGSEATGGDVGEVATEEIPEGIAAAAGAEVAAGHPCRHPGGPRVRVAADGDVVPAGRGEEIALGAGERLQFGERGLGELGRRRRWNGLGLG